MPLQDRQEPDASQKENIIGVIGVGGGGSNAVRYMYERGIEGVDFCILNTDAQALRENPVPCKLQIGPNLTHGLGAGANPDKGRKAALESTEEIEKLLRKYKMVFVIAGMGGGTGTYAAGVVGSIAQKLDILTVGIVTHPFPFEGKQKMAKAREGTRELRKCSDTVLVILNERLQENLHNTSISEAFATVDEMVFTSGKSIAEMIATHSYVNVDFRDIYNVMKGAGKAIMGSGIAQGESRSIQATEKAIKSPLIDHQELHDASKILLSITSSPESELQMDELAGITDYIQEHLGSNAEVIFGNGYDKELGDKIRVTIIATGFKEEPQTRPTPAVPRQRPPLFEKGHFADEEKDPPPYSKVPNRDRFFSKLASHKKEMLIASNQSLLSAVKVGQPYTPSDEEIAAMLQIPAYIRYNISLEDPLPEDPDSIVRHHLSSEAISAY